MKLYLCRANGLFGPFGDYIWATSPKAAASAFKTKHNTTPNHVRYEHA